ncbi:MAG: Crp/Fnr family transcriptional regulator [Geitlerinemataceae cyanobacterium]
MNSEAFGETFPLFNTSNPETLDGLLSVAEEHEYPPGRAVLMEDSWGNAVYFLFSGWVKVRRLVGDNPIALAVLGPGDFFGEMAILDESPRSTDVIALSDVKLLSVSAQRFIQTMFKDSQLHHRMLQLMVRRLRQTNLRFQLRNRPPAVKLASTLVGLADSYGKKNGRGVRIVNIPIRDLADVADIKADEAAKLIEKLTAKGWVAIDKEQNAMELVSFKQLSQLADHTG